MRETILQERFQRATFPIGAQLSAPRAALVFAHPDDETIALGAWLDRCRPAVLVHVTDGAPRNEMDSREHGFATLNDYRAARRHELAHALRLAGLDGIPTIALPIADQEAGLNLNTIIAALEKIFIQHAPEVIFTHPYEGGHPDHDACAFAVHRAVSAMPAAAPPLVLEGTFYHAGTNSMEAGSFLPRRDQPEEICYALSPEEQQRKRALLACFSSQQETLRNFPLAHECFRVAPQYDFHHPPHSGRLLYENYPWGMTAQRFCELTKAADAFLETSAACQ